MNGEQKVTPEHLARRAVVYLRQSSEGQVKNNLESQRLQYAMAQHASALGFREVQTIDTDLGASAAVAAKRRVGFERLLGAVALGEVGLILSRELSRLLRTDKDFCQLVELRRPLPERRHHRCCPLPPEIPCSGRERLPIQDQRLRALRPLGLGCAGRPSGPPSRMRKW